MSSSSDLSLPQYVHDHTHAFFEVPIKIVVIVVVTLVVRAVINRIITKAVEPGHGNRAPRILQPFRERVQNSAFFESTGLLSERRAQRAKTIGSVLKSFVTFIMFVVALMLILSELGIDLAPFIAGTSIVGVALGFGAQSIVKDFLNGMFMMLEDQYGVGDVIDFELASGTVEAVGLRSTRLRDINGTVWYVRNGEVLRVGNQSQGFATVVIDLPIDAWVDVGVASEAMLDVATRMREEDEWKHVFMREPELLGVQSLSRYETVIRLSARVRPLEQWRTARELRRRIKVVMDELEIGHPAPDVNSEVHVSQIDPDSGPPVPTDDTTTTTSVTK
ncbi:mechanosensitive ion channel family protein [Jatrophihabitans endophyticus]|uniref:mechanosensitive ion channel family protein n=1 Tax=Jatrophihabitans endophyticus TaxID=1206085 RepID=UPI0019F8B59C|nr:mechanosensitive ion channel domain-containing protein [Jatrophihabitans endophyticus]MBE7187617.1 mechanosensitive ion channel [Jatrophihabitans endophyticus]